MITNEFINIYNLFNTVLMNFKTTEQYFKSNVYALLKFCYRFLCWAWILVYTIFSLK